MRWVLREIVEVGRSLAREGLVSARAGNISYAYRDKLLITRTGSSLGDLSEGDILEVPLKGRSVLDERASVDLHIHRRIVLTTGKRAVVHAHPPCAVSLSLFERLIEPVDLEGKRVLGRVLVLEGSGVRDTISEALKEFKVVLVRGHGAFSAGDTLSEAYSCISTLEHSCRIKLFSRL